MCVTSSSGRSHWALASPRHQAPVHGDCCLKAPESQFDRRRGARHALAGCHFIRGIWADDSAAGPAVFTPKNQGLTGLSLPQYLLSRVKSGPKAGDDRPKLARRRNDFTYGKGRYQCAGETGEDILQYFLRASIQENKFVRSARRCRSFSRSTTCIHVLLVLLSAAQSNVESWRRG